FTSSGKTLSQEHGRASHQATGRRPTLSLACCLKRSLRRSARLQRLKVNVTHLRRHAVVQDSEHEARPGQVVADVANLGLVRPPSVYLGSIGVGLLVHRFLPVELLPASINVPIGVAVVLLAGALFISALRTFRRAGTPVPGNRPTTIIVRTGPYGFSR